VQVLSYELRMAALAATGAARPPDWDVPPAPAADLELYFQHHERVLVEIGFHDPANPRQTMVRLRRLLARIRPDAMELSILRGVLTGVQNIAWRLRTAVVAQGSNTAEKVEGVQAVPRIEDRHAR
jgi:tRNA (cytidine32/uridine32-2'-O)-methyltransferase